MRSCKIRLGDGGRSRGRLMQKSCLLGVFLEPQDQCRVLKITRKRGIVLELGFSSWLPIGSCRDLRPVFSHDLIFPFI